MTDQRNIIEILGIPIDLVDEQRAQERISALLRHGGGVVFTPNSEMLVTGATDPTYRKLFWEADLCLPDTIGLVFATLGRIRTRVPGADIARWVLSHCEHQSYSVTVVIWKNGLSTVNEVQDAIKRLEPNLKVEVIAAKGSVAEARRIAKTITTDVVLVGLGYPKQERWIHTIKELAPQPKLWMVIGGTPDYWTNKKPRAPKVFRRLGLEWFWRLLIQPNRLFRILRAVLVFPWLVYVLKSKPLYQSS